MTVLEMLHLENLAVLEGLSTKNSIHREHMALKGKALLSFQR
jgi:hypothetical protein